MKLLLVVAFAAGLSATVTGPRLVIGGVVDPHFRTDRSVDARSARTIVADLVRPAMSNEEKALAIFHWLRRVIYHSGPEEPMRHDFNKMINVFGYGSCYMQTHPLSHLYQQVGFPCRDCMHDGHHMIEVFYDGAWHCLDPHMTFYAYNRATPPAIASITELQADRTLAFDAVKEKRAGPAFLICGDSPKWFAGREGDWVVHPFDPHLGADQEFGAIRLPRGSRYVRTWKTGKFYAPHAFSKDGKTGPYHTCSAGSDRKDPINWPYWEPYAEASYGRHYGTGCLDYAPDLRGEGWKDGAILFSNLLSDKDEGKPALHPAAGGVDAEAIFFIDCPYIVTAAGLEMKTRRGGGGEIEVSVSADWAGRRRKWMPVSLEGEGPQKADISAAVAGSLKGYWVRIVMRSKDPAAAGIDSLKVHTDFQLNPYALPQLLPGQNKLIVTAGGCSGPWKFRLSWAEGDGWQKPREYAAAIEGVRHEATVEAAGPKLPRMEAIEFAVDP